LHFREFNAKMGFSSKITSHFRPAASGDVTEISSTNAASDSADGGEKGGAAVTAAPAEELEAGVSTIEAAQAVWGKKGFRIVLVG
jgi:hypothetical protein